MVRPLETHLIFMREFIAFQQHTVRLMRCFDIISAKKKIVLITTKQLIDKRTFLSNFLHEMKIPTKRTHS